MDGRIDQETVSRVRFRAGVVGESVRVVHAAVRLPDGDFHSVCGVRLPMRDVEMIADVRGMPCIACVGRTALAANGGAPAVGAPNPPPAAKRWVANTAEGVWHLVERIEFDGFRIDAVCGRGVWGPVHGLLSDVVPTAPGRLVCSDCAVAALFDRSHVLSAVTAESSLIPAMHVV